MASFGAAESSTPGLIWTMAFGVADGAGVVVRKSESSGLGLKTGIAVASFVGSAVSTGTSVVATDGFESDSSDSGEGELMANFGAAECSREGLMKMVGVRLSDGAGLVVNKSGAADSSGDEVTGKDIE